MQGTDERTTTAGAAAGNDRAAIGRRALLAGAGGAALLGGGAAPTVPPGHPDAALLAACADFHAADRRVAVWEAEQGYDEAEGNIAIGGWYDALERLTAIRPVTIAGLRAKAHAAYIAMLTTKSDHSEMPHEEAAALAVLANLLTGYVA